MRRVSLLLVLCAALGACGGNDGSDGERADTTVTPETGIDQGAGSQNFDVGLNPGGADGPTGSAMVTAEGGEQVRITIQLDRGGREPFPAEIREGTCDDLAGEAAFELEEVEGGLSESLIDTSMEKLRETPYALVILRNDGGADGYAACGDLVGSG